MRHSSHDWYLDFLTGGWRSVPVNLSYLIISISTSDDIRLPNCTPCLVSIWKTIGLEHKLFTCFRSVKVMITGGPAKCEITQINSRMVRNHLGYLLSIISNFMSCRPSRMIRYGLELIFLRKSKIFHFIRCHEVAVRRGALVNRSTTKAASIRTILRYEHTKISTYFSMRHLRYSFAIILHSGSFVPFTLRKHLR